MLREDLHISDEDLLLAVDGELPPRRAGQIRTHLAACCNCRTRMAEIEGTIADFMDAHRQTLDSALPPIEGPRALLRAQLAELASKSNAHFWQSMPQNGLAIRAAAVCVALITAGAVGSLLFEHSVLRGTNSSAAPFERAALPEPSLTPGATRSVTMSDICSMPHETVVQEVPTEKRRKVFEEYRITNASPSDYEIDFLIAPGLGGTADIHNLWPEPYTSPDWNALVKDALEEHLHQLVCAGDLDLRTAQRDIATDWIAAYKKYFHTDSPLSLHSRLRLMNPSDFAELSPSRTN